MGLTFTLRMFSSLSLYFALICTLLPLFGPVHTPIMPLIIMTVCSGLGYLLKDARSRVAALAPFVLLALCAFFVYSPMDVLVLLPAAAFCVLSCAKGLFFEDKFTYRGRFMLFVKILPAIILLGLVLSPETVERYTLPFGVMFLLSSVYLLQLLRQSDATLRQRRYRVITLTILASVALVGLALSTPAVLAAAKATLSGVYNYVLAPILMGLAYLMAAIGWLLSPLFKWLQGRGEPQQETQGEEDFYSNFLQYDTANPGSSAQLFYKVVTALAIVGLVALIVIFLRRMLGYRRAEGPAGAVEQRTQAEAMPPSLRPRLRRSPQEQVRAAFKRFLLLCRVQGIDLQPHTTSRTVTHQAARCHWAPDGQNPQSPVNQLRALYIKARYSSDAVTREEARQAKEHYTAIRQWAKKHDV